MTYQEQTLLMIKGTIADLSPERQAVVADCKQAIADLLSQHPEGEAMLAFALIGAELELQG